MALGSGLAVLHRIRGQNVQAGSQVLSRIRQQQAACKTQIDQLLQYQQEYLEQSSPGFVASPGMYGDRQLFLQRLEESIQLLKERSEELGKQEQAALVSLQDALHKMDSLRKAIDQMKTTELDAKIAADVSQCDEQSRIVIVNRQGDQPFE